MWTFTIDGFYSAVEYIPDPSCLLVRTRTPEDAQRLADWLVNRGYATEVEHTPSRDYGWRLVVPREAWGQYLVAATEAVDYSNFKHAVAERVGPTRAAVYGDVWADLLDLQHPVSPRAPR